MLTKTFRIKYLRISLIYHERTSKIEAMICKPLTLQLSLFIFVGLSSVRPLSVGALDHSASIKPYGLCHKVDSYMVKHSSWCTKGKIEPAHLQKPHSMKYGRQTIFPGPVGLQKGWCGSILQGSKEYVPIAISTKYIRVHDVSPDSSYCGKYVCVQVLGTDETSNKYPPSAAKKYYGKVFKGRIADMCSECDDDHIDVLADRPYTYAVINKSNPKASHYNSIQGPRLMPTSVAYGVGVWKAQWNFVDASTDCTTFFAKAR